MCPMITHLMHRYLMGELNSAEPYNMRKYSKDAMTQKSSQRNRKITNNHYINGTN